MTDLGDLNGRQLVQQLHPIQDPTSGHVRKAADELTALARYLVHATLPHVVAETLPHPTDVDTLTSHLCGSVVEIAQILEHLAGRLAGLRTEPGLAVDRPDPGVGAFAHAMAAGTDLRIAAEHLGTAARWLGLVQQRTAKLKLNPTSPPQESE